MASVATALEVISLQTAKDDLRLAEDTDEFDNALQQHIKAAVSFIGAAAGVPLTLTSESVPVAVPRGGGLLEIPARHVQRLDYLAYWPQLPPTGAASRLSLAGAIFAADAPVTRVWPPDGGLWPEAHQASVALERGLDMDAPEAEALKMAVLLEIREIFDGAMMRTTPAISRLIEPVKVVA